MIRPIHFFTICARNYLAMGAALNESLAAHHPQSKFTVFVLDRGDVPDCVSHLRLRSIEEIIPATEYATLCCYYDLLELSTAVKARCFQALFSEGEEAIVYLDPDIYLFKGLNEIEQAIDSGAPGVLIPHILSPLPRDVFRPSDLDILRAGVYNLGFLALAAGPDTDRFLDWWREKLQWNCLRDPREGVFVDQKWMDFAPVFLPGVAILRDATYNVAYWNQSERTLERGQDGGWRVNGSALTFFHFSGFDCSKPGVLSKHENRVGQAQGVLADMLSFYSARLAVYRYDEVIRIEFPAVRFEAGPRWDPICRILYRWKIAAGDKESDPRGASFLSWLASCGPGQFVPRYVQVLLILRPDLGAAFPDLQGRDWHGLIAWMVRQGPLELGIDPALVAALGMVTSSTIVIPGVRYVGYLRAHLGLGEAARGYVRALTTQGLRVSLVDVSDQSRSAIGNYDLVDGVGIGGRPRHSDVEIIHVNANEIYQILRHCQSQLGSSARVAIWAWETSEFPDEWTKEFASLDEVWVGSQFMAAAIGAKSPCPVLVVPHVVAVPPAKLDRTGLGFSGDDFLFLMQFDLLSNSHRKNPEGAIRAFKAAFPDGEPVRFIMKTINGQFETTKLQRLKSLADDARIVFWDEPLDDHRRFDLLAAVNCYVSLHRAEGFGLSLAESMAYGKPVIATGWSGNLEFMNVANSILVPFRLEALKFDEPPYRAGTVWAEPDQEAAAAAMRRVFLDRKWAETIGARAKQDIGEKLAPEVVGARMKERLVLLASAADSCSRPAGNAEPKPGFRGFGPSNGSAVKAPAKRRLAALMRELFGRPRA